MSDARSMTAGDVPCANVNPGATIARQSRRASLVEATVQTLCGYFVALATQAVVFPLAGIHVSGETHAWIGACFVGVSLVRGYVIRRVAERWRS